MKSFLLLACHSRMPASITPIERCFEEALSAEVPLRTINAVVSSLPSAEEISRTYTGVLIGDFENLDDFPAGLDKLQPLIQGLSKLSCWSEKTKRLETSSPFVCFEPK